jgi:hypothetical protein
MDLVHDTVAEDLTSGDVGSELTFYLATAAGSLDDAHALVDEVTNVPTAVDAEGKLTTTWGAMKTR